MLTQSDIAPIVALALAEDIGSGDITAGLVGAEEKALALPAKLVVPLILFVFPSLLTVLMLPAVVRMMEVMAAT